MRQIDLRQAEEMLRFIAVTDRDRWLQVAFGLKSEFGESAFAIWEQWSRSSPRYNPKHARPTWKHIKRRANGVTIGTIIKLAKDAGWKPDPNQPKPPPMSAEERKRIEAERERQIKEDQEEQERIHAWAAGIAKRIVAICQQSTHSYLARKGFPERKGLVIRRSTLNSIAKPKEPFPEGNPLVIPMRDADNKLTTLQMIFPDGQKRFLGGGKFGGSTHNIGSRFGRDLWLCEGYATGLTLYEALKQYRQDMRVRVCFSAHNMVAVSQHRHKGFRPPANVIADHDEEGIKAAKQTGMPYYLPPEAGDDLNDYYMKYGAERIEKALWEWLRKNV